jgi:hypothetical protein
MQPPSSPSVAWPEQQRLIESVVAAAPGGVVRSTDPDQAAVGNSVSTRVSAQELTVATMRVEQAALPQKLALAPAAALAPACGQRCGGVAARHSPGGPKPAPWRRTIVLPGSAQVVGAVPFQSVICAPGFSKLGVA